MNKEQITIHKEVIKWFCDNPNKGVWKSENNIVKKWELLDNPQFYKDVMYVQNDEYCKLRKALIDGKTVEYSLPTTNQWNVVDNSKQHFSNCFKYRVKPEKPEFKVGDWVTVNNSILLQFKQFTGDLPQWNKELDYEVVEFIDCNMKYRVPNFDRSIVKKWQPKENELCVFWNNGNSKNHYSIARYKFSANNLYCDKMSRSWGNIAPLEFIKTLKETRNENN